MAAAINGDGEPACRKNTASRSTILEDRFTDTLRQIGTISFSNSRRNRCR